MKNKRIEITYFTKYLVEYLAKNPCSKTELVSLISNKETGHPILDLYNGVSADFMFKLLNYLIKELYINEVAGRLKPTKFVMREIQEKKPIFYEEERVSKNLLGSVLR